MIGREVSIARTIRFVRPHPAVPRGYRRFAASHRINWHGGEREKEAGVYSLLITGSLLIIVIGLQRNRQPIRSNEKLIYYWRTVSARSRP